MMDLQIHLIQRLLHVLQMNRGKPDQVVAVPPKGTDGADFIIRTKRPTQKADGMQVLDPLAIFNIRFPAGHVLERDEHSPGTPRYSAFLVSGTANPPGRRWRTELPQRWPPSAAQTWCAVRPRHAFTKAPSSAMQWKESVSPVGPAHTRHRACVLAAASSRSCASTCTDATRCVARSNGRVC